MSIIIPSKELKRSSHINDTTYNRILGNVLDINRIFIENVDAYIKKCTNREIFGTESFVREFNLSMRLFLRVTYFFLLNWVKIRPTINYISYTQFRSDRVDVYVFIHLDLGLCLIKRHVYYRQFISNNVIITIAKNSLPESRNLTKISNRSVFFCIFIRLRILTS